VAIASWWPAVTILNDSGPYAYYAAHNPLADPNHPAGYMFILEFLGLFSRQLAFAIIVQHLLGVLSALLMFAAVKRLVGSPWPALAGATAILLSSDQIFLEHNIMSESSFVFFLVATLYAGVRAIEQPGPWYLWPLATGALGALDTMIRSAGLFLIPVLALAVLIGCPRPWLPRWRACVGLLGIAAVLLLAYAVANDTSNGRFEIGPATGWHLYARVARFANCSYFTPPAGTRGLCQTTPDSQRPGNDYYLHDPESPAFRLFGYTGSHDDKLKAFALEVIIHQPRAYLRTVLHEVEYYFVPSLSPTITDGSEGLSPQLDWRAEPNNPPLAFQLPIKNDMQSFFDRFSIHRSHDGLVFLHRYEQTFRFGGTLLSITTLLTLIGVFVGARRCRLGVFFFGVGGLALLVGPTFAIYYGGRYSMPLAGPMFAAAAITVLSLVRMERARRHLRMEEPSNPPGSYI
jgi:4-amino-4-deoxy-L-arabinose transferase-like glycosyltransferase